MPGREAVSTLALVPQDVVEATWKKVARMDAKATRALQKKARKLQPDLTGFTIGWTQELRADAVGLALYVMLVVFEMFVTAGAKTKKATAKSVLEHWKRSAELAALLESSAAKPSTLSALSLSTEEPHVLQYVIDALTEESGDDPVHLTEKEFWHLFAILKTVVDSMRDASTAASP
jgi:hypothetical protein